MLLAVVQPQLMAGEELRGVLQATHSKTFSADIYAIGVTPGRLILVPIDRRTQPKGPVVSIGPGDVVTSSVDGFGGGLKEFLAAEPGEIRITTATNKYKLMALGGGLDRHITSEGQTDGKTAMIEWLIANRR